MSDAGSGNNAPVLDDAAAARLKQQAENVAKAREAGWNDPVPFNYETVQGGQTEVDDTHDGAEWLSDAAIYQWDDDFGDVGHKNPELEKMLFEGPDRMRAGHQIKALKFEIEISGPEKLSPVREARISFHINTYNASFTNILNSSMRLVSTLSCSRTSNSASTRIQLPFRATAFLLCSLDTMSSPSPRLVCMLVLIYISYTDTSQGSGKTAAFLIPILSRLMGKARMLAAPRPNPKTYKSSSDRVRAEPLVLVVCPTRELACQIFDEARRLCYRTMLRPCVIYGGAPTKNQREQLEMGCDVLIATPGRLMDFMSNMNLLSFARLKLVVSYSLPPNAYSLSTGSPYSMKLMSFSLAAGRRPWTSSLEVQVNFITPSTSKSANSLRHQHRCRPYLYDVLCYFPEGGPPSCQAVYG